jgi:hypothetical protein
MIESSLTYRMKHITCFRHKFTDNTTITEAGGIISSFIEPSSLSTELNFARRKVKETMKSRLEDPVLTGTVAMSYHQFMTTSSVD